MNKRAQVGLFTILGAVALFAVFFVLSDFGTRARGYKIGVRFHNASGLRNAALVYLSGVPIGAVDRISLLGDYSTEVVMAIQQGYEIPANSRFLIQAPITGEPTVLIDPPRGQSSSVSTLPHEVLPIDRQPRGANPTSIADLLEQGQGEVRRLDDILAQVQKNEPKLISQLSSALENANQLTSNANRSLSSVTAKVDRLTDSLQRNLTVASNNVVDLTSSLNSTVGRDGPKVDTLLTDLTQTSRSFGQTVDSLRDVATSPRLKRNLLDTTRDFALTARTFAELTGDLRQVTGNPQTQAQLRDTVAQLDATSQKVDSLVGGFGGTSRVYGVDPNATPAPAPTAVSPGYVPTSAPATAPRSGDTSATSAPSGTHAAEAPGRTNAAVARLRERLNAFTKDLVELQVRASVLGPQRPGSASRNVSPLLTEDRGPQSDFNLFVLPRGSSGLKLGVNDVGSKATSTANVVLLNRRNNVTYGGGIEYSRLGVETSVAGKLLGLDARAYDLRHPTVDTYLNFFALPKVQIFGGERDLTHASRRTAVGLQLEF